MRSALLRSRFAAGPLLVLVIFVFFHWRVANVYFGSDEPMNLYSYWQPPLWKVAWANVAFWSKFVRPLGALYYLPLYKVFGLNPVPYNVVRLVLLLANTMVFYKFAGVAIRSRWVAALATIPVAYHARLAYLAYGGQFIYDVLCAGFYFAALLYYMHSRKTRGPLGWPQISAFLALYICALNSKEMAVTLPALVLAYECFYQRRNARLGPVFAAAVITAIFIVGKTTGTGALTALEAYRPVVTWARFADSNTRFLNTIFCTDFFTMQRVVILWTILLYLGVRTLGRAQWDPRWLFLLVWVVITPLPLAFLPGRGGPMLYIVAAGWALAAALALRALVHALLREPWFARLPRNAVFFVVLLGSAGAYVHETRRVDREYIAAYLEGGKETKNLVVQLRDLGTRPAPGSKVVFLNDPFPDGFDTLFIASLVWNDPTLQISLERKIHLPDYEIAQMDYIFDFVDGRLVLRKPAVQ